MPNFNNKGDYSTIKQRGETSIIDLSLDEEDIFNNVIHSKRRNMIRKAEKSGITVKSFYSDEGLKYFWPILSELHSKLGYTHLKESYYKDLITCYGPKKQASILVAFKENHPVSGIFYYWK